MKKQTILLMAAGTLLSMVAQAQVITNEDSLAAGLKPDSRATVISGYGEAAYVRDMQEGNASANLTRGVFFLGHKFSDRISFFSELEVEDAKVAGGEAGGEVAFEQAFIKFGLNRNTYITAGLFIPRIGITNENHLPTSYNTVLRPVVERKLIPATWRELGVCLYGSFDAAPGLNYSIGVVNGLNGAEFNAAKGIREGRFEGRDASANNLAITGSLLYYWNHFRMQVSGYMGGTNTATQKASDTLGLTAGVFGTPLYLAEANIQYNNKGFYTKALATITAIPDADKLNAVYGKNVAQQLQGFYAETGYNLLETTAFKNKQLVVFSRYENINMVAKTADNGIANDALNQQYVFVGLSYKPVQGVIVKADYQMITTGDFNPAIDPETAKGYNKQSSLLNIGIGYSF